MTKYEEFKGFWFLPSSPDEKVPGILYFKPNEEIRLELIGGLDFEIQDLLRFKHIDIIHGLTNENEKISLFNCIGSGTLNFPSTFPLMRYKCRYLITGKHLASLEDPIFNGIQVDFTSLYDWYPASRIHSEIWFESEDTSNMINFSISDKSYWEKVIDLDHNFSSKIYGVAFHKNEFDLSEFSLTQNTLFEILANDSKKSFPELLNKVEIFRQFLSIASLSTVEYINVTLSDNDDYQVSRKDNKILNKIQLYFIRDRDKSFKPKKFQFLFTHQDIIDIFPDILIKWYGLKEDFAPIRNHLIESIKNKKVFTSLDFLIIVQALEGYHRRFISKKDRISLKTRLSELINLFTDVKKVHNNPINITQVVKSRGYYSHFYLKDDNVLDGIELYELTEQLRVLLICCVLQSIGFNIDLIDRLISKNEKL